MAEEAAGVAEVTAAAAAFDDVTVLEAVTLVDTVAFFANEGK